MKNYSDKNMKGRHEAYYRKNLNEVKNKGLVKNALITSQEQIDLGREQKERNENTVGSSKH